jgi:hypothetical protein
MPTYPAYLIVGGHIKHAPHIVDDDEAAITQLRKAPSREHTTRADCILH